MWNAWIFLSILQSCVLKGLQKDANVVIVACRIEAILRIWPETWDYMAIYFPVSRKYLIKHWKCAFGPSMLFSSLVLSWIRLHLYSRSVHTNICNGDHATNFRATNTLDSTEPKEAGQDYSCRNKWECLKCRHIHHARNGLRITSSPRRKYLKAVKVTRSSNTFLIITVAAFLLTLLADTGHRPMILHFVDSSIIHVMVAIVADPSGRAV